jgi:hypothetical protein
LPKSKPRDVLQDLAVLDVPGFVQPIFFAQVSFDPGREFFLAGIKIPRRQPHQRPGKCYDNKQHWDDDDDPANNEAQHGFSSIQVIAYLLISGIP